MAKIWLERGVKRQLVSLLLFETHSKIKSIHDFFPQRQLLPSFHKKQIKFDELQLGANEIS